VGERLKWSIHLARVFVLSRVPQPEKVGDSAGWLLVSSVGVLNGGAFILIHAAVRICSGYAVPVDAGAIG